MHRPAQMACQWPTGAWKQAFRRKLLAWYRRNARDLEWRRTRDPYRVWISEIMLQQTQVATVANYYPRFIAALPTIAALASAPEHQVLRLWEGLGYYRRARQLHRAAAVIVRDHGGSFPREAAAARRLPGVGRYTAGAILSIAFDEREPILEANTVRLLSRLVAYRGDPRQAPGQALLWSLAEELLPRRATGEFNQALMELGALVCKPRDADCSACPVRSLCPTHRQGLQQVIPPAKTPPRIEQVREAAVVVRRRGKVLLLERQPGERWAGLWDFPRFAVAAVCDEHNRELVDQVAKMTGVVCRPSELFTTIKHSVTRFRIVLECHLADYLKLAPCKVAQRPKLVWVSPREFDDYPLSVTGRKLARVIAARMTATRRT